MSINNIQQNLLEAIDLIAINQASAVNFDTTEIATVLSKLENGNYWVSNGKVKYEAKSTETISYTENTQVYVSVSQGDYSQDKVIIGRYDNKNEDEKAYLYEDPYQRLGVSHIATVTLTDENEISFLPTALGQPTLLGIETSVNANTKPEDGVGYYGLQINLLNTNEETLMSFIIDSRNFIGNPYNMVSGIKHKNIFTLPNDFNISDVKKIDVIPCGDGAKDTDGDGINDTSDGIEWSPITLRFGYDLESETIVNSESKAFIGTDNGLNTYGEGDNDSYREVLVKKYEQIPTGEDEYFSFSGLENLSEFDNELNVKKAIKINDEEPQFGFQHLTTDKVYRIKFQYFIKTNSELNNDGLYGNLRGDLDTIVLNKDPGKWHSEFIECKQVDNFFINLENFVVNKLYIYFKDIELYELQPISLNNLYFSWVKDGQVYNPNNPTALETSVSWYKYVPNKVDEDLGVGWEKIENENAWTLDVSNNYLDHSIPEERFRARLVYNDVDYLSNVLVLKNKDYVGETAAAVSPTMTLRLNDDGIYLYDHTAQLYETEKTLKTISASSNAGFEDDYKDLYWLIPKNSTMIAAPRAIEKKNGSATEYWYWDYLPDIHFSAKPTDFTLSVSDLKDYDLDTNNYYIIGGNGIKFEQNIYIKRNYQPNYLNNTIQCKAFFGDTSTPNEEGSIDLKFVSANNSGVEASLGIELVSEKGYLGGDNEGEVEVKGVVYDKNGIPFEEQPNDIVITAEKEKNFFRGFNSMTNTDTDFYNHESHIVQVQKDRVQLTFYANSYEGDSTRTVVEVTNSPRIFSVHIEALSDIYNVEMIQDEIREYSLNNAVPNLYLVNDPWHINKVNNVYYSKSKSMTIHYVYDDAEWEEYADNNRKPIIPYKNFKNIPASKTSDPMSRFVRFEQGGDYVTLTNASSSSSYPNGVIQYELNENIKEVYIRVNKGVKDKYYGCLPYINFRTKMKEKVGNTTEDIDVPENQRVAVTYNFYCFNPILKAFCTWNSEVTNKPVQLTSYYQIPYFPTPNGYQLEGSTKFTYSSFGDMPYPASINEYKLFDSDGNEIPSNKFRLEASSNIIKINNSKKTTDVNDTTYNHRIALPELAPAEESFYTLNIYYDESATKPDEAITLIAQYPITLLRNGYAFKEINAWGGSTVTTEDYVISPMIGAGSKNSQNQFTGVIMGTSSEFPSTGLYGFQNGVATFGFKEDGSCFLGANEETGRIEFNTGSNGNLKIISNQFKLATQNLELSDTNGLIIKKNNEEIFKANTEGELLLKSKENNSQTEFGIIQMQYGSNSTKQSSGIQIINTNRGNALNSIFNIGVGKVVNKKSKINETVTYPLNDFYLICEQSQRNQENSNTGNRFIIGNTTKINSSFVDANETYSSLFLVTALNPANSNSSSIKHSDTYSIISSTLGSQFNNRKYGMWRPNIAGLFLEIEKTYAEGGTGIQIGTQSQAELIADSIMLTCASVPSNYYGQSEGEKGFATQAYIGCNVALMGGNLTPLRGDISIGARGNLNLSAHDGSGHLYGTWTPSNWSSDARLKHSIEDLNIQYEILFDQLQPKRYKYNNGTSNRYHTGFIAQEVLEAVESASLTTQDFAAMYLVKREDSGLDEPVWVLRRDEFVALNTWQIQKLKIRVAKLENEIKELKQNEINK